MVDNKRCQMPVWERDVTGILSREQVMHYCVCALRWGLESNFSIIISNIVIPLGSFSVRTSAVLEAFFVTLLWSTPDSVSWFEGYPGVTLPSEIHNCLYCLLPLFYGAGILIHAYLEWFFLATFDPPGFTFF